MSIAQIVAAAQAEGGAMARARMLSTCTVRRMTGRMTQNEETGEEVPEWEVVYTGLPTRLVVGRSRTVTIGGVEFEEATAREDFPHDTTDLADNDHVDITAGEWAGSAYRIVEAVKGDQMTARRVPVVEVPRPAEWA